MKGRFLSPPSEWGPVRRALGVWLIVSMAFGGPSAFAATYFVNAVTGNDTNPGTAALPWKRLTRALDTTQVPAVTSGDTVNVAAGNYDTVNGEVFPISFVNGVAVLGPAADPVNAIPPTALVTGQGLVPLFRTTGKNLSNTTRLSSLGLSNFDAVSNFSNDLIFFDIGANNIAPRIDHNKFIGFSNQSVGVNANGGSGLAGQFTAQIDSNVFQDLFKGVFLEDRAGVGRPLAILSPTISGNTFTNNTKGIELSGTELRPTGTQTATYAPLITGNTFTGGSYGVYLYLGVSSANGTSKFDFAPLISNNTFNGMANDAIFMSLSGSLTQSATLNLTPQVMNNSTITNVGGSGIKIEISVSASTNAQVLASPTISGNSISNTGFDGIFLSSSLSASTNAKITSTPTISNNTMNGVGGDGIYFYQSLSASTNSQLIDRPTISGNTLTNIGNRAIYMYVSLSASTASTADFSPTISNNTISQASNGMKFLWYLYGDSLGTTPLTSNASITGNRVTDVGTIEGGGNGVDLFFNMTNWKSLNANWTISGNMVDKASGEGIEISNSYLYGNTGVFRFSITGNTVTNNGAAGLIVSLSESSAVNLDQRILIDGNTATGNAATGISLSLSGSTMAANDIQITNNQITGNGSGLFVASSSLAPGGKNAVLVSCNTVTGNTGDGVLNGTTYMTGPNADYGGGNRSSPGGNQFFNNGGGTGLYDFFNNARPALGESPVVPVAAQKNWWGTTTPALIDSHIQDDDENPAVRPVDFSNFKLVGGSCSNVAPVANNDAYSTSQGTPLTVPAPGVLANDTDANGDPLTAILVTGPSSGTLTLNPNGSFTYTPNPAFTGTDSFTYKASDGSAQSNAATVTITVTPAGVTADLSITKRGPSALPVSGTITFTITVNNLGPSAAAGVIVNDTPSLGLRFTSNSGACTTPFPCNLGVLAAGASATIISTFAVFGGVTFVSNTAQVTSSATDTNTANNRSVATVGTACPTSAPVQVVPFSGQTDAPLSGPIAWTSVGATDYQVLFGPAGSGCNTLVKTVTGTSFNYSGLTPNTTYESRIVAVKASCRSLSSQCVRWTTTGPPCNLTAPQLLSPQSGNTISSPLRLQWAGVSGAESYRVVAALNGVTVVDVTTKDTFLDVNIGNGNVSWSVTAIAGICTSPSSSGTFSTCSAPEAPLAGVVGAPSSGRQYAVVVVNPSAGNVRYEFQEADNDAFANPQTQTTTAPSFSYMHDTRDSAVVFFYRVRAFGSCTNTPGAYSKVIRVVIVPITVNLRSPSVNVPAGTKELIQQQLFIPGDSTPVQFTATADRSWIVKIEPNSGILPPEGITLIITMDPAQLPNGTFTSTVIITTTSGAGRIATNGGGSKSAPVTINLVTAVVPMERDQPQANSLFFAAVGRLVGLNSQWRSDLRIFNPAPQKQKYLLNFYALGSSEVKQTTVETDTGATTALDDIVHNWYGFGEVGDSAIGVLEVRPLPDSGNTNPLSTIVSSQTYAVLAEGKLSQFVPAVLFKNMIGAGSALSMQQLAQSAKYRSNFAVVEASGQPASVVLSMFNSAGTKLFDLPVNLAGGEQKLLNGLLTQQGVSLNDGRMEVRVTSGGGKVTAYASVIDNDSLAPLFVSGKPVGGTASRLYVVAGVADLNNATATWRTDMQIFNSAAAAQTVNLTFYPSGNPGSPKSATLTVNPNEVKVLNSVLASLFATQNAGGAIHVDTANDSQLHITARTFDQTSTGTLGEFITAATPADGIDRTNKPLHILQVEDSQRNRTNVGMAEMTGKAATVEISVILPDSKVTPSIQVPLAANEFRQFGLAEFGLGNVYNARVSLRVVDGDGRITAYGSVIDQVTTAPMYVAAQPQQ